MVTYLLFSLSLAFEVEPKEKSPKTKIGVIHKIHSFSPLTGPWNIQTLGGPFSLIGLPLLEPLNFG